MKVLLVNPNTMRKPPVPPIGLEFVAAALKEGGHEVRLLDLCFSDEPEDRLCEAIAEFLPGAVGITVRNVDSVLYAGNEFYLERMRRLVEIIRERYGIPVFAGGAGLRADPEGIAEYLCVQGVVVGYDQNSVVKCLEWVSGNPEGTVVFSDPASGISISKRSLGDVSYSRYLAEGGVAGFFTHVGCSSSCAYCIEANTPVRFRDPEEIIGELRWFSGQGVRSFHLCDPEFNEDREFSLEFLESLKRSELDITWSLYLKPAEHNRKLFKLMKATGVWLVTLSIDSFRKCPLYWDDAEKIIFSAQGSGIKVVVDFITGFPHEDSATLDWCLDFFRRVRPDSVNINTYLRLYRQLKITGVILADPGLRSRLIGWNEGEGMVRPVFYNQIPDSLLKEKIQGDPLFRIDVSGEGVNCTRFG